MKDVRDALCEVSPHTYVRGDFPHLLGVAPGADTLTKGAPQQSLVQYEERHRRDTYDAVLGGGAGSRTPRSGISQTQEFPGG